MTGIPSVPGQARRPLSLGRLFIIQRRTHTRTTSFGLAAALAEPFAVTVTVSTLYSSPSTGHTALTTVLRSTVCIQCSYNPTCWNVCAAGGEGDSVLPSGNVLPAWFGYKPELPAAVSKQQLAYAI